MKNYKKMYAHAILPRLDSFALVELYLDPATNKVEDWRIMTANRADDAVTDAAILEEMKVVIANGRHGTITLSEHYEKAHDAFENFREIAGTMYDLVELNELTHETYCCRLMRQAGYNTLVLVGGEYTKRPDLCARMYEALAAKYEGVKWPIRKGDVVEEYQVHLDDAGAEPRHLYFSTVNRPLNVAEGGTLYATAESAARIIGRTICDRVNGRKGAPARMVHIID